MGSWFSQRKFALDLIAELGLARSKPVGTPLEVLQRFTSIEFDQGCESGNIDDELLPDPASH